MLTLEDADTALAEARASIAGAEQLDAATVSPAEVRSARLKLSNAEAALREDNPGRATRLAREATVDARLAETAALAQRARDARVLTDEVRTLQATIEAGNG